MTVPATANQPKYTTPPPGASRTQLPGYTPITITPPARTVQGDGRQGSYTVPGDPPYTMYMPPAQNLVSYPSWNGGKITVDQNLFANPTPVTWTSGGQTVTVGLMFDNKDTGARNFAYFGNGSNPTAVAGGKLETLKPGTEIVTYYDNPQYSSKHLGTLDATVAHSGNAPAWTLPQAYQIGGLNIYQTNPFSDPVTKITQTSKDSSLFFPAEVIKTVVETAPEWAPVVAFPLAVAVGAAGGLAPLFSGGTTAGLTGAGAGSAAGIAGGGLQAAGTGALTTGLTGSAVTSGLTGATIGTGAATATPSALGSLAGATAGAGSAAAPLSQSVTGPSLAPLSGGSSTTAGAAPLATAGPQSVGGGTAKLLADAGVAGYAPASTATGAGFGAASGVGNATSLLGGLSSAATTAAQTMSEADWMAEYGDELLMGEEGANKGALATALGQLGKGDLTGALKTGGQGLLDYIANDPLAALQKGVQLTGALGTLFGGSGSGSSSTGAGGGAGGAGAAAGKPLPVAPPLNRMVNPYPGDLKYYSTEKASPKGTWEFFKPKPATTAVAHGGPINGGGALAALESRYMRGPGGGQDDLIDAKVADGEYVLDASTVSDIGDGSNEEGARRIEKMVQQIRKHKRGGRTGLPPKAPRSPLEYLEKRA